MPIRRAVRAFPCSAPIEWWLQLAAEMSGLSAISQAPFPGSWIEADRNCFECLLRSSLRLATSTSENIAPADIRLPDWVRVPVVGLEVYRIRNTKYAVRDTANLCGSTPQRKTQTGRWDGKASKFRIQQMNDPERINLNPMDGVCFDIKSE